MSQIFKFLPFVFFCSSCQSNKDLREDKHSFSEPHNVITNHLDLDIEVNFDSKVIKGIATYKIENISGKKKLILDTYDLVIEKIISKGEKCRFSFGKNDSILGQALIIDIKKDTKEVSIYYQSDNKARALQWLTPVQTAGKKHPFLYTQSQAILARTWFPCQDSPGVRFSYTAQVKVPSELMAVMSAENLIKKNKTGIYQFKMEQAIPSYLMALAVGDISYKSTGSKTGIYSEPSMLEKAVYEFSKTQEMLDIAEIMYGTYAWGKYDILVLPPSFPFGGMENPRLTFVTPTILTGDRSLTSLIAHELAHSWSGNLVTNKTWDDFWLNEGFTVYFERRIMERLEGRDYADMLTLLGKQDLVREISLLGNENKDTFLKLNLTNRNPEEGLTDVAYEKGFLLLRLIEESVGRKQFDYFLKKYFHENAFKVIDTERFVKYLNINLLDKHPNAKKKIRLNDWIYGPGIPKNCPKVKSKKFDVVEESIKSFLKGYPLENIKTQQWTSHEWLYFLRHLPENLDHNELNKLDYTFGFTSSGNAEILNAWFQHTIPSGYIQADNKVEDFLLKVGRRKFLKPLYEALHKKNPENAKRIYKNARPNYHSVTIQTLDAIFL